MNQGTILGSQIGRWVILAALVVVLGALLLTIRPVLAQSSPPDAPTGLRAVVVNDTTVELYWTAPTNDGGAEITAYKIQQSADGRTGWADPTDSGLSDGNTPDDKAYFGIAGLSAGTAAHFRVRATNASGDGAPSNVVKAIPTPDGHPAEPTALVVEANGPAEINLAWTAPTEDGDADITGYMIEYTEMENDTPAPILPWKKLKTTTNDDTKYSNTGLSPVTKRWYRVSAINADDERGPVSATNDATTTTTTPEGVPAAPTGFKVVVVANDNIELYWTAPTNTGGGPIIVYRIESLDDANVWGTVGDGDDENDDTYRVDVTTLAAGVKRSYRVSAMNGIGKGLVSTTVTVEEPGAAYPTPPGDLTATGQGTARINLIWTMVPGLRYVVEYTEMENDDSEPILPWKKLRITSSNTASHTGLKPDTKRWYRVAAINSKGRSLASNLADATTAASTATPSVPRAPTGLRAVVVSGTIVELYWTAPTNTGGAEITTYKIQRSVDGNTGWDETGATVTTPDDKAYFGIADLSAGTAVHFRVLGINTAGDGAPTKGVKAIPTPDGHPAEPTALVVEANGPAEINLAWTAPTEDGDADITGYMIEYTEMENDTPAPILPWKKLKTTTNDDTKYSNTGLSPVTKRWYRVSAINADDERGPVSATNDATTTTTTPEGVPAAPTGFKVVVVANDNIELYWTAPTNTGGGPITVYRIESLNDANVWGTVGDEDDENDDTYRVDTTALAEGVKRSYRVSAMNDIEKGLVSMTVTVEEPGAAHPTPPADLTAVAGGSTSISLIWAAPSSTGASPITSYVVEYAEKAGTTENPGTADVPDSDRVGALPWKQLTTTSSNTARHTGLQPETPRWYRVAAINSKGRSLASAVASATTAMKGPFSIQGSNAVSLDENSGTDVGTYQVVGVDAGASVRWTRKAPTPTTSGSAALRA